MNSVTIQNYIDLIQTFLDKRIPIQAIEGEYNKLFYRKHQDYPAEMFSILDKLFADIECYDPECLPGEESAFRISAQEVYRMAQIALDKLNAALQAS